jgi:hypothetical protein
MKKEAASAGFYHSPGWATDYPRIQILTVEELLHGAEVKMPPQKWTSQHVTFQTARRARSQEDSQDRLDLG